MGFCMGGALSFLAGQEADVDAIAPFYGTPDPKLAKVPLHVTKSEEHTVGQHTRTFNILTLCYIWHACYATAAQWDSTISILTSHCVWHVCNVRAGR